MPNSVPVFHFGVPTCQKACLISKHPSYETIRETSTYTSLLYKKFYIILDIIVIHMICICIVHKNCIILHFYTSCRIKEKCAEFLFFLKLFCSLVKNKNTKRFGFYTLLVTRVFSNFPQLK